MILELDFSCINLAVGIGIVSCQQESFSSNGIEEPKCTLDSNMGTTLYILYSMKRMPYRSVGSLTNTTNRVINSKDQFVLRFVLPYMFSILFFIAHLPVRFVYLTGFQHLSFFQSRIHPIHP